MRDKAQDHAVMVELFSKKQANGFVTNEQVRRAASILGLTTRAVRGRLAKGIVTPDRPKYTLGEPEIHALYACKGNAVATHHALSSLKHWPEGEEPTLRTFQRAVLERLDRQVLAGARGGRNAHDACNPTTARAIAHRNDSWATDHKKLPNVIRTQAGEISEVWSTEMLDERSRMVMGFLLTAGAPTTEDVREVLAVAVEGATHLTEHGSVFVGGKPHTLHSDRGGDYVSWAATVGLVEEAGIARSFTMPYSPNSDGRVEAFHGTLERSICPSIPGYVSKDFDHRNPEALKPSVNIDDLLTLEEMSIVLFDKVQDYNFNRIHSSLGMTPFEAWCNDSAPITSADPAAIRAAMRAQATRKVDRGRIRFRNRSYTCSELRHHSGRTVQLRYLNSDTSWIDIDLGKGQLVRAWDVDQMPDDEAKRIIAGRAPAAVAFNTRMRAADAVRAKISRTALADATANFSADEIIQAQMAMLGPDHALGAPNPSRSRSRAAERASRRAESAMSDGAAENEIYELPTPTVLKGHSHAI